MDDDNSIRIGNTVFFANESAISKILDEYENHGYSQGTMEVEDVLYNPDEGDIERYFEDRGIDYTGKQAESESSLNITNRSPRLLSEYCKTDQPSKVSSRVLLLNGLERLAENDDETCSEDYIASLIDAAIAFGRLEMPEERNVTRRMFFLYTSLSYKAGTAPVKELNHCFRSEEMMNLYEWPKMLAYDAVKRTSFLPGSDLMYAIAQGFPEKVREISIKVEQSPLAKKIGKENSNPLTKIIEDTLDNVKDD